MDVSSTVSYITVLYVLYDCYDVAAKMYIVVWLLALHNDSGQVVHIHVSLSSNIIWYWLEIGSHAPQL